MKLLAVALALLVARGLGARCRCDCLGEEVREGERVLEMVREAESCGECEAALSSAGGCRGRKVRALQFSRVAGQAGESLYGDACEGGRCALSPCEVGTCSSWRSFRVAREGARVSLQWSVKKCLQSFVPWASASSFVVRRVGNRSAAWLFPVGAGEGLYVEDGGGCRHRIHAGLLPENEGVLAALLCSLVLFYLGLLVYYARKARASSASSWRHVFLGTPRACGSVSLALAGIALAVTMIICVSLSKSEGHPVTTISSSGMYYPEHLYFCMGFSLMPPLLFLALAEWAALRASPVCLVLGALPIPFLGTMAWTDGVPIKGVHIAGALAGIGSLHIVAIVHTYVEFKAAPRPMSCARRLLFAYYVASVVLVPPFVVMWFTVGKLFEWLAVACLLIHFGPWLFLLYQARGKAMEERDVYALTFDEEEDDEL